MKRILLIALLIVVSVFAGQAQSKVTYTCIMHPQVHMDHPGKCPICGMTLMKKTIKAAPPKNAPKKPGSMDMPVEQAPTNKESMAKDTAMKMNMPTTPEVQTQQGAADSMGMDEPSGTVNLQPGRTVRYDLYVTDTMVNYTGKRKHAYAINGQIPAPTLIFTEGDTAEIYLHNQLKKEDASLHWHGVILPNPADGVPYLTTAPIHPGGTHLYKFAVVQNGTYWYHSHTALQEQAGMYGALIFKKRNVPETPAMTMHTASASVNRPDTAVLKEFTLVLSEWADENPMQIQRRLRTGNDWYSIKKGSTQSYVEAIKEGQFSTKLTNEWKRMKAMDVSDVYYNRFLANGQPSIDAPQFKAGDRVKLHVVNAGSSTYFWLGYSGGKIMVLGNDGNDVTPVEVDRLIIAPAETYDLLVTIPGNMSYELRATSEDRTGYSSFWLGSGMKMPAPALPRLKYFEGMKMMNQMMRLDGTMKDMGMNMSLQKMDMNAVMYPELTGGTTSKDTMQAMGGMDMPSTGDLTTLNYDMLCAPVKTSLPDGPTKVLHFTLTGNMIRYVWTIDNKTVNEADRILIRRGENVRLILTNNSMMRHPMHLHGHDFRVLNSQGEYAPLKNVIDILPMETDTIEFAANKEGNWFFHCHILYHMMAGMGRVFTYENSPPNPELPDPRMADRMFRMENNMYHLTARAGLESNGSDGLATVSSNRYEVQELWHLGLRPEHGYESETSVGRYFGVNQWWFGFVGFDYHYKKVDPLGKEGADYKNLFGQRSDKNDRKTFMVGLQYTLPWLVLAEARVDGNGKLRFQLSRDDIPITRRLRFNFMANTDKEYAAGFRYIVSKWFAFSTHYDSDMGLGAGITLTY